MLNFIFLLVVTAALTLLLRWAFRVLPEERWQMLAAIPRQHLADGCWQGLNLTYYGVFSALAYATALTLLLLLLGAVGMAMHQALLATSVMLAICIPASRLVSRWVEGKKYNFTVAGAAFIGIVSLPILAWQAKRWLLPSLPIAPILAAFGIAYCAGEGLGRLACISFGCCHGRPLAQCPPWLQKIFAARPFIFRGATKKIAYQAGQADMPVLPIQAITAVVCLTLSLIGTAFFLAGYHLTAMVLTIAGSQIWRFASEFARADFRGGKGAWRLTVYQVMALAGTVYTLIITWFLRDIRTAAAPNLVIGFAALWQPTVILFIQAVFAIVFLYTGCSRVTFARLSFHVHHERI